MFKLGKKPAAPQPTDLLFLTYRGTEPMTLAPIGYGHGKLVSNPWGMLANDTVGDCAIAGPMHETMLWCASAQEQIQFTDQNAIGVYSAVTGYTPDDPSTDQGSDVHDVLNYRRDTGLPDSTTRIHKIGAFVSLTPGDWNMLLEALYAFEAVGVGLELPDYAMEQFQQGSPWMLQHGGTVEGGHYVPVIGRPNVSVLTVVTWGATQLMTRAFYEKYNDESWGILSEEMLTGGKSLEGFDIAKLQADIAAL